MLGGTKGILLKRSTDGQHCRTMRNDGQPITKVTWLAWPTGRPLDFQSLPNCDLHEVCCKPRTLRIQSPSENGNGTVKLCWGGGCTPRQPFSDNMIGCLGKKLHKYVNIYRTHWAGKDSRWLCSKPRIATIERILSYAQRFVVAVFVQGYKWRLNLICLDRLKCHFFKIILWDERRQLNEIKWKNRKGH